MNNNRDILTLMKNVAVKAVLATKPVNLVQGEVISINPLTIQIDQKLVLPRECLKIPQYLTDYKVNIEINTATEDTTLNTQHTHEINYSDATINGSSTQKTTSETGEFESTHKHTIVGTKEIVFKNALKVGDNVLLIREQGGQTYFVVDRVV